MAVHTPIYNIRSSPRTHCKIERANVINNNTSPATLRKQAQLFADWYKKLMDDNRNTLGLYLGEGCVLQWFGRTIKTTKNIKGFVNCDMNCNTHVFTTVNTCSPIKIKDIVSANDREKDSLEELATPMSDCKPNIIRALSGTSLFGSSGKRSKNLLKTDEFDLELKKSRKIRMLTDYNKNESIQIKYNLRSGTTKLYESIKKSPSLLEKKSPSPSKYKQSADSPDLQRKYMEASCVLHFSKVRNKRGANIYNWERQCKLQVEYSESPVSSGEYVIWMIIYSDNNKCKRNLMAAFDAVGD